MNKAVIIGRLGADPETRTTGGGMVVANISVATTGRRKNKDGEWEEETEWHRCVAFGRTAENMAKYLAKGRQVAIEGRIKTEKWTDKDGSVKFSTKIYIDDIEFLGSANAERKADPEQTYEAPDDSIPF